MSSSRGDIPRLAVATRPQPDESLAGFIVRLSGRAGYRKAEVLACQCGLRQPGSLFYDEDLGVLAGLVDIDPDLLREAAYPPAGRRTWHTFQGGALTREFIDVSKRRWCPTCLAKAPFHRQAWDIALLTACPVHRIRLASYCPGCRRNPGWSHPSITICRCGRDLRKTPTEAIGDREALANESILDLATSTSPGCLPAALAACARAELPWLAMCLGMFMTGWRRQRRIETLVAAGPDAVAAVLIAGMNGLHEWPGPLRAYLGGQRCHAASRPGVYGARKSLGGFYDWLTGLEPGAMKDAVAEAARGLICEDPELARRVHRSRLLSPGTDLPLIGLNEAKKVLGARSERVRDMVKRGAIPATGVVGRGVPMLLDAETVAQLAEVGKHLLDLRAAARKLAISRSRFSRLVGDGLVVPVRRVGKSSSTWAFDARDLDNLLAQLAVGSARGFAQGKTVGFEHAVEVMRRRGVDLPDVLRLILSGGLPCVHCKGDAPGLKRLVFDVGRLRDASEQARPALRLSVQAAAARLGMKWEGVRNLIARGHLAAEGGTVAANDVAAFARDHVFGKEIASLTETSPRSAAVRLAACGVRPIAGPMVDGSRLNVFRRPDVTRALEDGRKPGAVD